MLIENREKICRVDSTAGKGETVAKGEKHEGGNNEGDGNGLLRVSMGDGVNCTVSHLMARNVRKRWSGDFARLVPGHRAF